RAATGAAVGGTAADERPDRAVEEHHDRGRVLDRRGRWHPPGAHRQGIQRVRRPVVGLAGLLDPHRAADAAAATAGTALERSSVTTSVLYDVPGPRARARNAGTGVVVVVLLVAALGFVVYRLAATGQFDAQLWEWIEYTQIQLTLLSALGATLRAF